MGAADGAFERTRLASERIARLKRDLDRADHAPGSGSGSGRVSAGPGCDQLMAARLGELDPWGWFLLHDVHWPGRPLARLDHVLVGPGGVIVIGAKSWNGKVEVTDGVLRQNGYARHPAIEVALGQAAAVAALLPAPRRRFVRSLICMAGQHGLSGTTAAGIEVHGIDSVVAAVAGLPDVLDSRAIVELYTQLGRLLTQPQVPDASGPGGRPGRVALAKNAGAPADASGSAVSRASTTLRPAADPSAAVSSLAAPSAAPPPAPRHASVRNSGFRHATVLPSSVLPVLPSTARPAFPPAKRPGFRGQASRQTSRRQYSGGLDALGREYQSRPVLRSAGMALIAGLVSTALLAPPLWLLWELLPK
ncbi:nuclease-related domain-containing protein [Arthrobacter sp. ZGTC131]|uniref:nuclease-related domain-containing protein n=1 Tax=Arthrobacter sp. ZGTC131 TaxID=2058898 RepID=UPI000CE5372E|nr:nuclease-related domain-containing protein [Arthrobacter sp. ZGTC131]